MTNLLTFDSTLVLRGRDVIFQTRETVFHWKKRVENTTRSGVFFDEIPGVWITDETLSRVFDISSQSIKPRDYQLKRANPPYRSSN